MSGSIFNEEYLIPDNMVGLVIGRGGEQIKRLQMESGCKIRIESESNGSPERACTLSGSQESIDEAKRMLDEVVKRGIDRQQGRSQGGYGNGNPGYQQQNRGGYQPRRFNNQYQQY
ncbi:far upstream element-binding 1 [Brachionus plicatilis]|uniref:Far upstream element-binding 1 n=1 Tax=Brachionus plicatilis TaxID=10195 RepID=A0A3M7QCW9_BRAPC|nr:far upstream element-binding 1 [Brachionus plicatilis]